jgi:hypothetical protein
MILLRLTDHSFQHEHHSGTVRTNCIIDTSTGVRLVTSQYLVEKLVPRNNALSVVLHRVQYLEFVGREGNQAAAFSSPLYVAEIHIPVVENEGVPRRPTRGSTHRTRANTSLPGNDEAPGPLYLVSSRVSRPPGVVSRDTAGIIVDWPPLLVSGGRSERTGGFNLPSVSRCEKTRLFVGPRAMRVGLKFC